MPNSKRAATKVNLEMFKKWFASAVCLIAVASIADAQQTPKTTAAQPQTTKKTNARPAESSKIAAGEKFDKAMVAEMAAQCVRLETEAGAIELEMLPETAPETVRNFLNLVAIKAFDTTVFNRVVPGFVVQGGNLWTREKPLTPELDQRARRTIADEPNQIRHVRGIVSMARGTEPNTATTNFFILVGEAPHLDNSFAAFARVTSGMETVDSINKAPVENEKPAKPVRLSRAVLQPCPAQTK